MKTPVKIFALLLSVLALASCGSKGVDQATKDAMTQFETEWTAAMNDATTWTTAMQGNIDKIIADHGNMRANTTTMTEEERAAMKPNMDVCAQTEMDAKALLQSANNAIAGWQTTGQEWATWKKEVEENKVPQEDATAKMAEWNNKLSEVKMAMADWDGQWVAMNEKHVAAEQGYRDWVASKETTPAGGM